MLIKSYQLDRTIGVVAMNYGPIFRTTKWPSRLGINDYLRATCGTADEKGWHVYHEVDNRWIVAALEIAASVSDMDIGPLAMADPVCLSRTPAQLSRLVFGKDEPSISLMAASALACKVFARAWDATEDDAAEVVRMNLFTEGATV